jgi:hypothetical protein
MLAFATRRPTRALIRIVSQLPLFWFKYVDTYLNRRPRALDVASGYYFMGRRAEARQSDAVTVDGYRGALL